MSYDGMTNNQGKLVKKKYIYIYIHIRGGDILLFKRNAFRLSLSLEYM